MKARKSFVCAAVFIAVTLASTACNEPKEKLPTRTFVLKHLKVDDAVKLVSAYVPLEGTMAVRDNNGLGTLQVEAPQSRLDQIADVLAKADRATPNAQLTFQIIEADGFATKDSAIADVEGAIREIFNFKGYRLLASALVIAHAPGHFTQVIGSEYVVEGTIKETDSPDAVHLDLKLSKMFPIVETSVDVPDGQTVVVGSGRPSPDKPAMILVVRNKMK